MQIFPRKPISKFLLLMATIQGEKVQPKSEIAGWAGERYIRRILNPFVLFGGRLSAHPGCESEVEESTALEKLAFNAKIQVQALLMRLSGTSDCEEAEQVQWVTEYKAVPWSGGKPCVQDRGSPCFLAITDHACSGHGGVQTQGRGVNAGGMLRASPVSRALAGMGTSTQKKPSPSHPQSSKALNGLKGSRKSCPVPMLAGSWGRRGDGGGSGHNTSIVALWADTKHHLGKTCPVFENHTDAKKMEPPEEC